MPQKEQKFNWNTVLLTIMLGVIGFYGSRAQTALDTVTLLVAKHEVMLLEHDKSIGSISTSLESKVSRQEFSSFKSEVGSRIGLLSNVTN